MIVWMVELGTAMIAAGLLLLIYDKVVNRKPEGEK